MTNCTKVSVLMASTFWRKMKSPDVNNPKDACDLPFIIVVLEEGFD